MATDPVKAYRLDDLACALCDAVLVGASPMFTDGAPRGFQKGHLTVCGHCSSLLIMGDSNFMQLTPEQFAKLPKATQDNLQVVQASVRMQMDKRKQQEENESN